MTEEKRTDGEWEWVPHTAIVVYPRDVVMEMLGHENPGSTRKEMSRYDIPSVTGYEAAQVDWMIGERNPSQWGWKRVPKPKEKAKRNPRLRRAH